MLLAISCCLAALNWDHCSVPSLPSKVSSLLPTIWVSINFYFDSLNGMHWPSFASIQITLSLASSSHYGALAINCAIFNEIPVMHLILRNYPVKLHKGRGGKWLTSTLAVKRKNHTQPHFPRRSISTHTSFMPLGTMLEWPSHLAQQTHSPPKLWVYLDCFSYINVNILIGQAGTLLD